MKAFERRLARARGELISSAAAARITQGKDGKEQVISEAELVKRVCWLASSTTACAQQGVNAAWRKGELERFCDEQGPSFASVAWERCFGRMRPPRKNLFMPSRALRIAQARAGETLRSTTHQRQIITAALNERNPPAGTDKVSKRNAYRAIGKTITARKAAGMKRFMPKNFLQVRKEAPSLSANVVRLDATDDCFAYWKRSDDGEITFLMVKLPIKARPSKAAHWQWHQLRVRLPRSVRRAIGRGGWLAKPALRLKDGRLLIDLVTDELAPQQKTMGAYLSLDWGEKRLLTGTIMWLDANGELHSTGRPLFFESRPIQAKLAILRSNASDLQGRIARIDMLLAGQPDSILQGKRDAKALELQRIWTRYSNLSSQLAHAGARWAVEMARLHDCQGILTEDLASLEARFPGRAFLNARINNQVRGKLYEHMRHKARQEGMGFASRNPRGTSSSCPRCRAPITHHQKASDNPRRGRGWLVCACGFSADRDHAAAECIGARCLNPDTTGAKELTKTRAKETTKKVALLVENTERLTPTITFAPTPDAPVRRSHKPQSIHLPRPRKFKSPPVENLALAESASASADLSSSLSSLNLACSRAGRVSTGRCVRPGDASREATTVVADQRSFSTAVSTRAPVQHSRNPARALHGMSNGFTGQLTFTPTNLPKRPPGQARRRRHQNGNRLTEPANAKAHS